MNKNNSSEINKYYNVQPYDIEELKKEFVDICRSDFISISGKAQIEYFDKFLQKHKAKTMVFEDEYIESSYLSDYSAYYVCSFNEYRTRCTRIHFFSHKFQNVDFSEILRSKEYLDSFMKDYLTSYIGYIVVKPLPISLFGRTCLKPPPKVSNHEYFLETRKVACNLFGIKFTIPCIPFQEQDRAVGACATSALWSAFEATAFLFQHTIPSLSQITRAASKGSPHDSRHFPNHGLNTIQMASAVRYVGLEPSCVKLYSYDRIKRYIYAYLKGNMPIILGGKLYELREDSKKPKYIGMHAVTVTGFENSSNNIKPNNDGLLLSSSKISKVFIHDDQVGPYSELIEFDPKKVDLPLNYVDGELKSSSPYLTQWKDNDGNENNVIFVPHLIVLPLYLTMRISFEIIYACIYHFNLYLLDVLKELNWSNEDIKWDIFHSSLQEFREFLNSSDNIISGSYKESLLTETLPLYLWRGIAREPTGEHIFELLFDSTDLERGDLFLKAIIYKEYSINLFKDFFSDLTMSIVPNRHTRKIIQWFIKNKLDN